MYCLHSNLLSYSSHYATLDIVLIFFQQDIQFNGSRSVLFLIAASSSCTQASIAGGKYHYGKLFHLLSTLNRSAWPTVLLCPVNDGEKKGQGWIIGSCAIFKISMSQIQIQMRRKAMKKTISSVTGGGGERGEEWVQYG